MQQKHDGGPPGEASVGFCGDGVLDPGEACDDGNLLSGDGCSPTCELEECDATTCFTGCCNSLGECVGGVDDTACGTGGIACASCTSSETICYQQECLDGDCTPGEQLECGFCGMRDCEADGTWGDCGGEGECLPDAIDIVGSCGNCGQLIRTCGQDCQFGVEECVGEGVCPAGDVETGTECGNCGQDQRVCNNQCLWEPWDCAGEPNCPGGGTCCAGGCTDTQTDPDHCGICGHGCGAGESCCSGDCADTQTDPDHCSTCGHGCGATQQCCSGSCSSYTCITGGSIPWTSDENEVWPLDPTCPASSYTVGILTQRHWHFRRKYAICVEGGQAGTITTCTGDIGVCSPATCPAGTAEIGLFVDRNGGDVPEQQRICVGLAAGGTITECSGPIGSPNCTPPACGAGDADIGIATEHDPGTSLSFLYRICITPQCPPPCP